MDFENSISMMIGLLLGILLGIVVAFTDLKNEMIKHNVGAYNTKTGDFYIKDLNETK